MRELAKKVSEQEIKITTRIKRSWRQRRPPCGFSLLKPGQQTTLLATSGEQSTPARRQSKFPQRGRAGGNDENVIKKRFRVPEGPTCVIKNQAQSIQVGQNACEGNQPTIVSVVGRLCCDNPAREQMRLQIHLARCTFLLSHPDTFVPIGFPHWPNPRRLLFCEEDHDSR